MELIPAILAKDYREIEKKAALVRGLVDTVQVDICDGKFAPNATWPYAEKGEKGEKGEMGDRDFRELLAEKKGLPFWDELDYEFDLMIANPAEHIAEYVRIGATRVYVHVESFEMGEKGEKGETGSGGEMLSELIHEWKHAVEIGLALKPSTPLSVVEPFIHEVASVQCMGNDKISFGGVGLDEERVLPKIAELRKKYPALAISVDIGVNLQTAPRLIAAGASRLVAGSAIFGAGSPRAAIEKLRALG